MRPNSSALRLLSKHFSLSLSLSIDGVQRGRQESVVHGYMVTWFFKVVSIRENVNRQIPSIPVNFVQISLKSLIAGTRRVNVDEPDVSFEIEGKLNIVSETATSRCSINRTTTFFLFYLVLSTAPFFHPSLSLSLCSIQLSAGNE